MLLNHIFLQSQDKTQHLQKHVDDNRHGRTYEEILESLQEKVQCGVYLSAGSSLANSALLVFALVIVNSIRTLIA